MSAPIFDPNEYFPFLMKVGDFGYSFTEANESAGTYNCETNPTAPPVLCNYHGGFDVSDSVNLLGCRQRMPLGTFTGPLLSSIEADVVVIRWACDVTATSGSTGCEYDELLHINKCSEFQVASVFFEGTSPVLEPVSFEHVGTSSGEQRIHTNAFAERASSVTAPDLDPAYTASGAPAHWQDFARAAVAYSDLTGVAGTCEASASGHTFHIPSSGDVVIIYAYKYNYPGDGDPSTSDLFMMVV